MDNMYKMFGALSEQYPLEQRYDPNTYHATYDGIEPSTGRYVPPTSGEAPVYFNYGKYLEPYASTYFGSSLAAVQAVEDPSFIPVNDLRIDPNKIFSADIQTMKTLAADQIRIKKMFEQKLMESLTEKGKVGLTEDDINAMQAVTSAGTAIAGINKAQVDIKKTITDIRLKQQQYAKDSNVQQNNGNTPTSGGGSGMDAARSLMDNIFALREEIPISINDNSQINDANISDMVEGIEEAESLLPNIIGGAIEYEARGISPVVVVNGYDDSSAHIIGIDSDKNRYEDYAPLKGAKIKSIDRNAKVAIDSNDRKYELIVDQVEDLDTNTTT